MISFGEYWNVPRIAPALTIQEDGVDVARVIVEASIKDLVKGSVLDSMLKEIFAW